MTEALEIPTALDGERIDRVVALLSGRSRSVVAKLIETGAITLSGEVVTVTRHKVSAGDVLEISDESPLLAPPVLSPPAREIHFTIVHVDDAVIVIDKPAGLVVHPGAGHRDDTLVSGLIAKFPEFAEWSSEVSDPLRPGIVHRLDKETSGLLVVARTAHAYEHLTEQLRSREMHRQYRTLVNGHLGSSSGTIEAPIGRSDRQRTLMAVTTAGKPAITHYEVQERYTVPDEVTLLQVTLETGRTHQIRVHFSAIENPVVGDVRYGGGNKLVPLARPFLHAEKLIFIHPTTEEEMEFSSELPQDLKDVLAKCASPKAPIVQ